jgi:REP element-mobilizing transposase RayT
MPNHFHMLVRVKDFPSDSQVKKKSLERKSPTIVSEQFRKLFMSYSKAINKQEKRSGSLFQKNFRRKEIRSDAYFAKMIFYIHNNPVHHKFTDDLSLYRWSSYDALVKDQPTKINKLELLQWFGGKNDFIEFHKNVPSNVNIDENASGEGSAVGFSEFILPKLPKSQRPERSEK